MTHPGYQPGSEPVWWWKVALHLDEAQTALANAMAHNLDDQRPVFALQDRLREGQAILLEIFRAKGLLPGSTNGRAHVPPPGAPASGWIEGAVVSTEAAVPVEQAPANAQAPANEEVPPPVEEGSTEI